MPSPHQRLSVSDVRRTLRERCFSPESPRRVGVELEWLTMSRHDPASRIDPVALAGTVASAGPSPGGSTITFEPGGQLEVSSPPCVGAADACAVAEADVAWVTAVVGRAGVDLVGLGADPQRPPQRVNDTPRYRAMETYFDTDGPTGRRMMANTASVQVNIGVGPTAADVSRQWRLVHRLGPTLAAAFANSPILEGRPSGFRSARLATWLALDRSRAAPVDGSRPGPQAWADYVLDARLMLIRTSDRFVPVEKPISFGQWVTGGHELGWPTSDDLDYHLSTLFPPVRPRGWLELRMLDALPDPWWQVPVAVATALLTDPAGGEAAEACAVACNATDRWVDAARTGLAHPALVASARGCFAAALTSLPRLDVGTPLVDLVADFAERWVEQGRTPADDRLDEWANGGVLLPRPVEVGA